MTTFILAFFVLAVVISIMAVGVIFRKKPIAGTCASLNSMGANGECVVCGKTLTESDSDCGDDPSPQSVKQRLFYAADNPQKQIHR